MQNRKLYTLFFLGAMLLYLSFSPGRIFNMGYTGENIKASNEIMSVLGDWASLRLAKPPVTWPRHGILELIFEIPFLLVDKLFSNPAHEWNDRFLSVQPVIATSLLCTLIFIWVHQITSSLVWAYILSIVAGFSTIVWPYAYIGLETTQSLFLMLSAYLALGLNPERTWPRTLLFGFSCAFAMSLKTNSVFLSPAIGYLIYAYFKKETFRETLKSLSRPKPMTVVAIIAVVYSLNAYTRTFAPVWSEGFITLYLRSLAASGPLSFLLNVFSFFGSPNKGLFIYCPVTILCLAALGKAYRIQSGLAIFAVLALTGLVIGCSLFYYWSDETWGPRYLHACIGPLIICLAATRDTTRFLWRREIPLVALAMVGIGVSFLGVFFYYGTLHFAATRSTYPTIEAFQYEPEWNHIRFNARLLEEWIHGPRPIGQEASWPPARHRWYPAPGESPLANPERTINLRDYAKPQPVLFRDRASLTEQSLNRWWYLYLISFWLGAILFAWLARRIFNRHDLPTDVQSAS